MSCSREWIGTSEPYLDNPWVEQNGRITFGLFGGDRAAGANTNEDAALVRCADDGSWEFAVLADAHGSAASAALVLATINIAMFDIEHALDGPLDDCLNELHTSVWAAFSSDAFRSACRNVEGETACLITARKGPYLWWFSIGDVLLYAFHPEYASLGQYGVNQRHFFEWLGKVNTFDSAVPTFATGVKRLRGGANMVIMATDGVVDCGDGRFNESAELYRCLWPYRTSLETGVRSLLAWVRSAHGRDSASILGWVVDCSEPAPYPST